MKTYTLFFLVAFLSFSPAWLLGQCTVTGSSAQSTLMCGNCTQLSAYGQGQGQTVFSENFNAGTYGPGWSSSQQAMWNNPCIPNGVDGTTHVWMGNSSPVPRILTTQGYDLTPGVAGVTICFDMVFAIQGNAAPCEGPDEPDEGVYLQYSVDGGSTWVNINYFDPNGGNDPQLTNWNNWCFELPAAALSSNTMIRWFQVADSGADYDHWGIDNVVIYFNDPTYQITWLHDNFNLGAVGGTDPNPVCPTTSTSYVVQMTNGTSFCFDTVYIAVTPPTFNVTAFPDTAICAGSCVPLQGTAQVIISPAKTPTYENNEISMVTGGNASVNINITDLNMTQILPNAITQVCINSFSFTGTQICTNFSGCNCNGTTISMGSTCNLNTASFNVYLNTPSGCQILLVPQYQSTGGAYGSVCFVPAGGQNITSTTFPASGNWNPQEPFSDLNGCDANGIWSLEFDAPGGLGFGVGSLTGWSISFNDPEISYVGDYSWSPTTDMTGANTLTPNVCPTTTTNYMLTVADTAGCASASDIATVTVNSCSFGVTVNSATVCPGDCADISATIVSGTGPYTYLWSNGLPATAGPHHVCPSATTTYSVTITDNGNGGATSTASGTVTVNTLPSASAGADQSVCPGIAANLLASGGTSYVWSNGILTASNTVSPTLTTTYTVTVTGTNGCISTDDVTVTVLALPTANAGLDQTVCPGVSATLTATGGTGYLWSTGENTASITVNPSSNTSYTVTVSGSGGCTATDDVLVNVSPSLNVIITPSQDTICIGGNTILTASGASTYLWSGGETANPMTVSPLSTTSYTVTGTSGGCSGQGSFTIEVVPSPVANAGNDQSICAGTNANLTATGGVNYIWSSGATSANTTVSPTTTTTYVVTVINAYGCTATDNVQVTVISAPVADAGPDQTICSGSLAQLTASGGVSYLWNTGDVTAQISVSPVTTTTYSVTVTTGGTCTATDQVTVNITPDVAVSVTASATSVCAGQVVNLTASGANQYVWSNGATGSSISVNPATTTTYTVTGTTGTCSGNSSVTITVFPIPVADAGNDQSICAGFSATLTASGLGSYLWSTGESTQTIIVSPHNTTDYFVTVTNGGGCSSSDQTQVRVNDQPDGNAGNNQTICHGGSATLTASGGDNYLWSTGAVGSSITVSPNATTTYAVIISSNSGCSASSSVTITVSSAVVVSSTPSLTLCNGQVGFLQSSVTGGTPPYNYYWNGQIGNAVYQIQSGSQSVYNVYVVDAMGCTSNVSQSLVYASPPVELDLMAAPLTVCPGESVVISASVSQGAGGPYIFRHNGQIITPPYIIYPEATGSYEFSVEDNCGSIDYESIQITVFSTPVVTFTSDTMYGCQPLRVNFNQHCNVPVVSSLWDFGDNSQDFSMAVNPSHTFHFSGVFDVSLTVTSNDGCKSTIIFEEMIEVFPLPEARYVANPNVVSIIKPEVQFTNLSSGASWYIWHFGDGDSSSIVHPAHIYDQIQDFNTSLIAFTDKGCKDTAYLTVVVKDEYTFYAPTAFSPDNDGINDVFFVTGVGIDENNFKLMVFDRWGQVQFETNQFSETSPEQYGWDGTTKSGQKVPVGTYAWIAVFKNAAGNKSEEAGSVTVIR